MAVNKWLPEFSSLIKQEPVSSKHKAAVCVQEPHKTTDTTAHP